MSEKIAFNKTDRGFCLSEFEDLYGEKCNQHVPLKCADPLGNLDTGVCVKSGDGVES